MAPDLTNEMERTAYRRELRQVALLWRRLGLMLLAVAAAGLSYDRFQGPSPALRSACWGAFLLGWLILLAAIIHRTRYHKRRMAGD